MQSHFNGILNLSFLDLTFLFYNDDPLGSGGIHLILLPQTVMCYIIRTLTVAVRNTHLLIIVEINCVYINHRKPKMNNIHAKLQFKLIRASSGLNQDQTTAVTDQRLLVQRRVILLILHNSHRSNGPTWRGCMCSDNKPVIVSTFNLTVNQNNGNRHWKLKIFICILVFKEGRHVGGKMTLEKHHQEQLGFLQQVLVKTNKQKKKRMWQQSH